MSEDPKIHIDLYNFEDPVYEDSKYVLTSPRSLEACAKVGAKPIDILYKPLADFQEELLPQDVPLRTIYNIYDEHEQERQRLLKLCKEERKKLVEASGKSAGKKSWVKKSASQRMSRSRTRMNRSQSEEAVKTSRSASSLQRTLTAWATSVGHKRVTNDELNSRVKKLHDESQKIREELLSKKSTTSVRSTPSPSPQKSRPKSATIRRSRSTSSLMSTGSYCIQNAQPLTNQRLKKTLDKSIDTSHMVVTPRDQRILELMMAKGEQERAINRDKFIADLTWEHQRKIEEESKVQSEMKRRRMLAEENRIKEMKKMVSEKHHQRREKSRLLKKEQALRDSMDKWEHGSTIQQKQKDLQMMERKDKQQLKRRLQVVNLDGLLSIQKSRNKKVKERDENDMQKQMALQQEFEMKSVAQRKQDRLLRDCLMKMLHNRKERNLFEDRHAEVEKQTKKNTKNLEKDINVRMSESDRKYHDIIKQRDIKSNISRKYHDIVKQRDIKSNISRLEREKKQAVVRVSQHKMEEELDEWREDVINKRKVAERQANENAIKTIEKKALKAHSERVNREKVQQENIKRIQDEAEAWKQETEDFIAIKDRKITTAQHEKDQSILQSRFVASQSQQLRDELKERYGGESFDKKLQRVELYNKLGLGYSNPPKSIKSSKKR